MSLPPKYVALRSALQSVGVTVDGNKDAILDGAAKYIAGIVDVPSASPVEYAMEPGKAEPNIKITADAPKPPSKSAVKRVAAQKKAKK